MRPAASFLFFCFLLAYTACSPATVEEKEAENKEVYVSNGELKLLFQTQKIEGTFVLYDMNADKFYIHNEERAEQGFLPASTFKIPHSLIALETGIIRDAEEIIPWDGIDRGSKAWNRDHNLRSAYKASVIWFYQELARKIGKGRMQYWVRKALYGNQETTDKIDYFWLTGNLRVSAIQQINFLRMFYNGDLEFTQRSVDLVKSIMVKEKTSEYTLSAKTGWATLPDPDIGWYVGYVERGDNVYFFALNMDIRKNSDEALRKTLTRKILKIAGVL